MEPVTTISLVSALVTTYEAATANYIRWSRRLWRQNHYLGSAASNGPEDEDDALPPGPSALGASLVISGRRIREAYDRGFILIGPQFSRGDDTSRNALSLQLSSLRTAVETFEFSLDTPPHQLLPPLDLQSILLTSESVRSSALHALVSQYARMAATRPLPKTMPGVRSPRLGRVPTGRMEVLEEQNVLSPEDPSIRKRDDDEDTVTPGDAVSQVGIYPRTKSHREQRELVLQRLVENDPVVGSSNIRKGPNRAAKEKGRRRWDEPPSPPPTPPNTIATGEPDTPRQLGDIYEEDRKIDDNDTESMAMSTLSSAISGPRNGVFSIFCPQALSLQVDSSRPVPTETQCTCGYIWRPVGDDQKGPNARFTSITSSCSKIIPTKPRAPTPIARLREQRDLRDLRQGNSGSLQSTESSEDAAPVLLKDGFRLTTRFLGKSHCSRNSGFGCVLCTSAGRTEIYRDADALKKHLNEGHNKWQMLHHLDMK